MTNYRNVCEIIVPNDLCIGCGLCVGVCPPDVLQMQFNKFGEYIAVEYREGCLPKCDLCLRACPFWNQDDNETTLAEKLFASNDDINHSPETGFFLDCYVGYSRRGSQRINGSSGGLATWFLQKVLEKQIADKIVTVVPSNDSESLYQFAVLEKPEQLEASSRSCYYPVQMGDVIRQVMAEDGRYIITGLPCFLKGIRLAMRTNRRLRNRVIGLVGLVCGQTKSKFFVEYLAAQRGGNPSNVAGTTFRIKDPKRPANDYGHKLKWKENGEIMEGEIFWSEGIDRAWNHDYFKPNSCQFCDDIFAETADVTFMDAWLPKYIQDYQGHTIVLNRNEKFSFIWQEAMHLDDIEIEPITIDQVIKSQQSVILDKRDGLQYRLNTVADTNRYVPQKRVEPAIKGNILQRYIWRLKMQSLNLSRQVWAEKKDAGYFHKYLRWIDYQLRLFYFLKRLIRMIYEGRVRSAMQKRTKIFLERTKGKMGRG